MWWLDNKLEKTLEHNMTFFVNKQKYQNLRNADKVKWFRPTNTFCLQN